MAMKHFRKFTFLIMGLLPLIATAEVPRWKIVPNQSSIMFTATQNNSPVTGQFKSFTGEISFDPDQLSASHVTITVDIGSVTTSYEEVAETLKTSDWFNIKLFPQAVFKANSFTKMGKNQYQARGTLTILDKTVPIKLTFTAEELFKASAHVDGTTTIKRSWFGVGKGEWASTKEIKDPVTINFTVTATRDKS